MISEEHQKLVNALAQVLEKRGIQITEIDISGTPHCFDQKYRNLPKPAAIDGSIPDLMGKDTNGTIHLGEAETDMEAENINGQLKKFSTRVMTNTNVQVPFHVIVPLRIRPQMEDRIRRLGLGDRLSSRQILIWS